MNKQSLQPIIEKLESLFSKFNEKFYNNELQTPVITVSPDTTKGAYGWCTAWKAWSTEAPKPIKDLSTLTKEQMGRIHKLFKRWCEYVAEDSSKPFADYTVEKFFEVMMQSGSFHTMNRHIENMEYELK